MEIAPQAYTRSDDIALADSHCAVCDGVGQVPTKWGIDTCPCVHRTVFQICLNKWRTIVDLEQMEQKTSTAVHRTSDGKSSSMSFGRPREEYVADFEALAKRTLDARGMFILRCHLLYGAPWFEVAPKLGLNKGNFYHEVYRVRAKLGRVFRDVRPYPLYPLDEYFGGTTRRAA